MGLPIQLVDLDVPFAWEVPDLLNESECVELLAQLEGREWAEGTVNGREGRVVRPELRDVDVCFWKDEPLASLLQSRLRDQLPASMRGDPLVGIRPNVRVYRYGPGQFFAPHRDQKYRQDKLVSHLGLLLYLDRVEEGGATWFSEVRLRAIPRPGLAVLFQNATMHAGEPVVRGKKHVLRADVMYEELNPV